MPQGWIRVKSAGNLKFSPSGHWFCPWGKLCKECYETFVPRTDGFLLFKEPLFHLPREGKGKQTEPDTSWCDVFDDDGVAQLQEVLQVCTCVLDRQTIEMVCLYLVMRPVRSSKFLALVLTAGPMSTLATAGVE